MTVYRASPHPASHRPGRAKRAAAWFLAPLLAALTCQAAPQAIAAEHGPKPGGLLEAALDGPMAGVEEIVFAVRTSVRRHYYENFGFGVVPRDQYPLPEPGSSAPPVPLFGEGGRLCRLNLRTGKVTVLLDDPQGAVRDPQVHYGGAKILFSYRRGEAPHYHLWEIDADGSGLRQLTDGPYDDVEPTYLPDGGIMFCSSRCRRVVGCFPAPVAVLYRCDAGGEGIRPLSANPFTDNTPGRCPTGA